MENGQCAIWDILDCPVEKIIFCSGLSPRNRLLRPSAPLNSGDFDVLYVEWDGYKGVQFGYRKYSHNYRDERYMVHGCFGWPAQLEAQTQQSESASEQAMNKIIA